LLFVVYGQGIQEAIRGKRSANTIVTVGGIVDAWRNGSNVSALDVDNIRFFPNEDFFGGSFFRLKVSLALQKMSTFHLALVTYATDKHEAVELLVKDVEDWYRSGIYRRYVSCHDIAHFFMLELEVPPEATCHEFP